MSKTDIYDSKVDWWVPAVVIFTVAVAFIGPVIDGELVVVGAVVALLLCLLEIAIFSSVKYQICDGKLGVRNLFYRWEWFPIEKITEVKKTTSVISAPCLSFDRLAIKFSDKRILKTYMPLEISPKDRDSLIARLKEVNPEINVK